MNYPRPTLFNSLYMHSCDIIDVFIRIINSKVVKAVIVQSTVSQLSSVQILASWNYVLLDKLDCFCLFSIRNYNTSTMDEFW